MKNKRVLLIVIIIQVLFLAFIGYEISDHVYEKIVLNPDISNWESRYIEYGDAGWEINENIVSENPDESEVFDMIYGPFMSLPRGSYGIYIEYSADETQSFEVYSFKEGASIINHDDQQLPKGSGNVSQHFTLIKSVDDLEVRVRYNGKGDFVINNIEIVPSNFFYKEIFAYFLLFSIILDMYIFCMGHAKNNENRKQWIDVCRGFAILLVLLGHENPPFKWLIFGFHMPLFFIISGYLYHDGQDTLTYIKKLFRNYIIPYIGLCVANLFFQCIRLSFEDSVSWYWLKKYIVDIIYSGEWLPNCLPLWFLTALFITMVMLHLIHRFEKQSVRIIISIGLLAISVYAKSHESPQPPWNMYAAFVGVFFAESGYIIKNLGLIERLKNVKWYDQLACLTFTAVCGYHAVFLNYQASGEIVDIHPCRLNSVTLTLVGAILLSYFVMAVISIICDKVKYTYIYPISVLGRNTMIFFGFDFAVNSLNHNIIPLVLDEYETWYLTFPLKTIILIIAAFIWMLIKTKVLKKQTRIKGN